ncbi:peptidoglycan DD-metalloendopeptidase family protein [Paraburkholderia sp. Tr-20389]|uniref:M23 family metallopeptidase n=1 Tax=Paraburkholderia sp. Tr-20389 TaxID=2703903 RepID=UPI00197F10EC|nr:M23 family metallopeptidase [Paraburkholderia sp. Tr-20389]MBN3754511.1 peptidoglycan DD-metalloendopeptidase family protein [Paraburkholderia sp. Tr-20389]
MSPIWGTGRNLANGSVRFVTRRTALTIAACAACGGAALALAAGIAIGRDHPKLDEAGGSGDSRVRLDYTITELGRLNAAIEQMDPRLTRLASQVATLHDFETRLQTIKTLPRPVFAPPVLPTSDVLGDDAGDDVVDGTPKKAQAAGLPARRGARPAADEKHEPSGKPVDKADKESDKAKGNATDKPNDKPSAKPNDKASETAAGDAEGGPSLPPRRCDESIAHPARDAGAVHEQIACLAATLSALEQEVTLHVANWESFPGRMPVDGARFGSPFGNRIDPFTHHLSFHPGVDLVAMTGTPILAAAGGRVIHAGPQGGYGNAVEIDHGNGLITRYGHASKIAVQEGDLVLPRQHIADVGSTGRSTGPHLHFEVLVNGAPVDPTDYLALFMGPSHG